MKIMVVEDDALHMSYVAEVASKVLPKGTSIVTASDGVEALEKSALEAPDGLIMDLQMPGMNGIAAASAIWASAPDTKILFWSNFSDEAYVRGISRIVPKEATYGYLLKTSTEQRLSFALVGVFLEEQVIIDREVRSVQQRSQDLHQGLNNTEFEVLSDIALGLTDRAIAERRMISVRTVQSRLKQLYDKLGVDVGIMPDGARGLFNARSRAVYLALSRGLLNAEGIAVAEEEFQAWLARCGGKHRH